jgi:hypothetical protein
MIDKDVVQSVRIPVDVANLPDQALREHLELVFKKAADECFKFITDNRKSQLVATEFSFTRNSLSHVENEA